MSVGVAVGSAVGAGLADGSADGSAAIVPMGAAIEKTSSEICSPIRILRRRKKRRDAADTPNIDKAPLPGDGNALDVPSARSVMANAIGSRLPAIRPAKSTVPYGTSRRYQSQSLATIPNCPRPEESLPGGNEGPKPRAVPKARSG